MSDRFIQQFDQLQQAFPAVIVDVRGRGLMLGVELSEVAAIRSRQLQKECLKRGLIVELGGRHGSVVRFLPPLIITASEVDEVCQIFGEAIQAFGQNMM
jgi:diaminobutyrate-2-oxoglutarate transaminase